MTHPAYNVGHGHVRPRPDGVKARCGGPGLCSVCSREAAAMKATASRPARTLVAFAGLARSGKSTAAMHLVDAHGWQRIRFAGPLKSMMAALGLTNAEIEGDRKELPCELLCGQTPRHAMQTIGTEWGRQLIGPDVWIRAWRAAFDRTLPGSCIVVDDCRFPNEAEAVQAAGGIIVRVERHGDTVADHVSEGCTIPAEHVIRNAGSTADLLAAVDRLV